MDAFHQIYEDHSEAVRRFALFLTGDSTGADDLVAEVFIRAWQARRAIAVLWAAALAGLALFITQGHL